LARRREDSREAGYRVYLTDALKAVAENTARIGGGQTLTFRWAETLDRTRGPENNKPASEIISEIAEKAGIIINHEHI
jgi:hypothetical protein